MCQIKIITQYSKVKQRSSSANYYRLQQAGLFKTVGIFKKMNQETERYKRFEIRFNELKQFKERFNHCLVPQNWKDNPSLGNWVGRQRQNYKKYGQSKLFIQRAEKLNSLGFKWVINNGTDWDYLIGELLKFKNEFGHCNVPQKYKKNHFLGVSVNKLRWYYKNKGYRKLPMEEIHRLNSMGFIWVVKKRKPWEERFDELKKFKEKYGHFNKYIGKDSNFIKWVLIQRKRSEKGTLTKERYHLLNSIGFFDYPSPELIQVLKKYKSILRFGGLEKLLDINGETKLIHLIVNRRGILNKQPWETRLKQLLLKFSNELSHSGVINFMIKYEEILIIREIERQIGCPINTIHKTVRGIKPLPVKWEEPLKTYLEYMAKYIQNSLEEA